MEHLHNTNPLDINEEHECEECFNKGICSVNPNLSSIIEVILLYIKELSFYLTRLKDFGITNEKIKETIIQSLFNIVTNAEYNQDEFHELISNLYDYIYQSRFLYEKACNKKNVPIETHKSYFKYSKSFDLTDAIRKGEKYFLKQSMSFSQRQKDLYAIIIFLVKSLAIKILELESLGKKDDEAYYSVLNLLNSVSPTEEFSEEKTKDQINKAIETYYNLVKNVFYTQIELYGETGMVDVSFSTYLGKAILVSGTDLKKLELILKATEKTDIDVYTHGLEMLMAHSFPKLRSYKNLKGHFGSGLESSLIDFASFPGAILMTKATLQRVEYLYRGRLFTLDPIAPSGVVAIKEYDFEPLIKAALDAKGFLTAQQKPPMKVGFIENEINQKVEEVMNKIITKEIKHLYIIGLLNSPNSAYKEYFMKFFELMPKDCFAFATCCPINRSNVFHLDSFYDYSMFYKILKKIQEIKPINEIDMSVFLTKCDKHTISNLLYLKHLGIRNVYMCKCPPTLITPAIVNTLQEMFEIKEITNPKHDLDETLNSKRDNNE